MSFASWYESPWHHPAVAWLATLLVLFLAPTFRHLAGPRRRVLVGLQLLAALDALCTGPWSPFSGSPAWNTAASVVFVILGDARFLVLLQDPTLSTARWRRSLGRGLLVATGFSLAAYVASRALPASMQSPRYLFLTYELLFLGLLLLIRRWLPAAEDAQVRRAQRRLTRFELLQYGLWVTADLWLLYGGRWADYGYALRLLPNALYYAGFAAFAAAYGTLPNKVSQPAADLATPEDEQSLAV